MDTRTGQGTDKIKWLRIELTNACNFNCVYCTEQFMKRKKGFMDVGLATRIIDEVSRTHIADVIGLQFMGEALMHPAFAEIAAYAKEKNVRLKLVTNGSLLSGQNIDNILKNGIEDVYISFFTPDEYSYHIRGAHNISYEEYEARVKKMVVKKIQGCFATKITIGLLNTTYCFLPRVKSIDNIAQAKDAVIRWIENIEQIQRDCGIAPQPHDLAAIRKLSDIPEYWTYTVADGIFITFIEVSMWANQLLLNKGVKIKPDTSGFCNTPFEQLFVGWDGKCTCCCLDYDCTMNVGDAGTESITAIWNGEKYRRIRDGMRENTLVDPYCQMCRGKINIFSFLRRIDKGRLLRSLSKNGRLSYIFTKGWKRFRL